MPPQTHVPLTGVSAAAQQAESDRALFVLSGLLSDQIFAHDLHRGSLQLHGPAIMNPLVTGEPIWQTVSGIIASSFAAGAGKPRIRDHLHYARSVLRGDPTAALPNRDIIAHPIGLTDEAADRVTSALRESASRARTELWSAAGGATSRRRLPAGMTSIFFIREMLNTCNLQAAWLNHCMPRGRFLYTPYADRELIEYALTLPTRLRIAGADGMTVDKLALRTAYHRRGLPAVLSTRMHQARIDAIPVYELFRELCGQHAVSAFVHDVFAQLSLRYDVGPGNHPLLGSATPDPLLLVAGRVSRLSTLQNSGRPTLIDVGDADHQRQIRPWPSNVDVIRAQLLLEGPDDEAAAALQDVEAMLIRPDGVVAWIAPGDRPPQPGDLCDSLHRWFGHPSPRLRASPPGPVPTCLLAGRVSRLVRSSDAGADEG